MSHSPLLFPARIAACAVAGLLAACSGVQQHAANVAAAQNAGSNLTLGTVQREIRVGMSGAEVAQVLGAPNIVTTDEQRRETWVYDKIATQSVSSGNSGGAGLPLLLGVSGSAGAASSTQRTLTVVIKFDNANRVRDYSYRSSSF